MPAAIEGHELGTRHGQARQGPIFQVFQKVGHCAIDARLCYSVRCRDYKVSVGTNKARLAKQKPGL